MSVAIRVIANTVPAITMVLGFLLILADRGGEGWIFVLMGFVLQVLWLFQFRGGGRER